MPLPTYSPDAIARYFLAKSDAEAGDLISNLKLQKLCYYAQGVAIATRGEPLFNSRIEAWMHGPVVPALYQQYRECGADAIPPVVDLDTNIYAPADRMLLDDVYDYYGQFSAWRLRQMTHAEAPWIDAFEEGANREIGVEALRQFFETQIDDDYAGKYVEISERQAQ